MTFLKSFIVISSLHVDPNTDDTNNVADNNGNVATGNNNNNEGSKKLERMRKTKELKQDKKENEL